ncbi:MAG: SDR family NAD(P)-dependent oxidoreductase [Myxococcales bacterium]|nr:SDR family NAD(P)-dependent oxidoreductase [Myxococcales bacterium]
MYALTGVGASGFGGASTAEQVSAGLDLAGRHILVTGCNSGLGLETCRVLAQRGATVIGAARTLEKAEAAVGPMGGRGVACELSDPASVRAAVASLGNAPPLDAIVCNAGIMALPERQVTHGVELQFFTNHVGHFILVTGLLPRLVEGGRVVVLSSAAHKGAPKEGIRLDDLGAERAYGAWANYGQAKLANLLFARELARRLDGGRRANAVHPGVIATGLARSMNPVMRAAWALAGPLVLKSIPQGAATQTWAAVNAGAADLNGEYLADCNVAVSSRLGADMGLAARLWEATEAIVARV